MSLHPIKITYDAQNGIAIPDGRVKEFLLVLAMGGDAGGGGDAGEITVSTSNIIHSARLFAVQNKVAVEFVFEGKTITPNEYGAIHDWPRGFADYQDGVIANILTNAMELRKQKKRKKT